MNKLKIKHYIALAGLILATAGALVYVNRESGNVQNVGGITVINSTDTLKDSRAVINANFDYLDDNKLDNADMSGDEGVTYTATGSIAFDCSEVEGTGINCSGEDITLDATGDWTGTLDGSEASAFATSTHTHNGYQSVDADLTTLAGITMTQGDLIVGGASSWGDLAIGTNGYVLQSNGTTAGWVATSTLGLAGGSGTPGGSDTQVQFNDSSSFGGDSGMTFNKTTDTLTVTAASTTVLTNSGNSYLGTIVSGTWNGTAIGVQYGGTGSTTLNGLLKGNGTSAIQTAVKGTDYFGVGTLAGSSGYFCTYNVSTKSIDCNTNSSGSTAVAMTGSPTISTPTINIGSDATGDILYRSSGGGLSRLAIGNNGYVLKSNGSAPTWVATSTLGMGEGSGASDFLGLTDTPDSYSGEGSKCVAVNSGATALEFVTCGTGGGGTFYHATSTATAGQTVFDLPFSFTTGDDSLSVYVNGIRQTIPDDFSETDTNTITFAYALDAGDKVMTRVEAGTTAGTGSANIATGTAQQIAYYASTGTSLSGTSTVYIATNEYVGIGTTSPSMVLDVDGNAKIWGNLTVTGSITGTLANGSVGIANMASVDFGAFTCNGSTCALDQVDISSNTNLTVTATGLQLSSDAIALATGYSIPLTATTTDLVSFRDTPSGRITAGRSLTWSTNTLDADSELYTECKNISILQLSATTTAAEMVFTYPFTITEVGCSTNEGSAVIQLDERAGNTPNTAGTDVMSSTLTCDSDSASTTSFANATIAARAPLNLDIDSITTGPSKLRVYICGTKDD